MRYLIYYLITLFFLTIHSEHNSLNQSKLNLQSSNSNHTKNTRSSALNQLTNSTIDILSGLFLGSAGNKETIGNVVFNVHHFTQFVFDGNHVYIYSPKKNEENVHQPQKWTFFYVPILQPVQSAFAFPWLSLSKLEIRVRLALGTPAVEAAARQAIANQFEREIVEKYSKSWVIAPLMLDSLTAYVVTIGSTPVPGVVPYHIDNPNSNTISLRFICVTFEAALVIAAGLLTGDLDIEVAFYFAGMHRVRTNMMTITATQLQSVLTKTTVDGGGTNTTYIHRDQASEFIAKYMTNVKKLIYIEDSNANISILTYGLEDQLIALFRQAIDRAKEVHIKANAFGQVWNSADLNPDRITSEMSKMFVFNQTETAKHHHRENYYSIYQRRDFYLPVHMPLDARIRTLFTKGKDQRKITNEYEATSHSAVSESDIQKAALQASIEGGWEGKKFIPKAFKVYRLLDVVDRLQVAVIAKQLLAEKASGAVIRRISTSASFLNFLNLFSSLENSTLFESLTNTSILTTLNNTIGSFFPSNDETTTTPTITNHFLTGEIKLYAGSTPPPSPPWLLCDGSIVSRTDYPRLFSVIGTNYGQVNDSTTFRLPDLRGRVPIGVDINQIRINQATNLGAEGGTMNHSLTVEQLPSHVHDRGSLQNSYDGQHTHVIDDPGHNHGGLTSTYAVPSTSNDNYGEYNYQTAGYRQWQAYTIETSFTKISLQPIGNHTHQIIGQTSPAGRNEPFSILPPFQTFFYIIYAD